MNLLNVSTLALLLFGVLTINVITDDGWQNSINITGDNLTANFTGLNWTHFNERVDIDGTFIKYLGASGRNVSMVAC